MSASVASKNLYELLGNDPPSDDDVPKKAPREVVKTTQSSKKKDEAPAPAANAAPRRQNNRHTGNERAFRDREAGSDRNVNRGTGEAPAQRGNRGTRGGRGGRREFDRHSQTGKAEHPKQADQAWGATEGNSEWQDELAGAELAQKDAAGANPADPNAATPDAEAETPAEEEGPKVKTYEEYLAELEEKKAQLGGKPEIRKPTDAAQNKKWANAKEFTKEEAEYFAGESREKTRIRERKQKQVLDIDMRFNEPARGGDRPTRGGRGGRGGDRAPRGAPRGGDRAPRGDRAAAPRAARAPAGAQPVNLKDDKAFPTLGA